MNGVYFNGLDADGQQTALANIPGSVTTDYILFSLNVASGANADINYGWDIPCVLASNGKITTATSDLLIPIVNAGLSQGQCQRVWLTIGAAVDPNNRPGTSTFANIQKILDSGGALMSTLLANFAALAQAFGDIKGVESVGFDMDYEEGGEELSSRVANVTIALYKQLQSPVTFCPYQYDLQDSWIAALQKVYSTLGTQPVVGYNLQTYAGGYGNDPTQWAKTIGNAPNTGIADAAAFVWPIVSCDSGAQPVSSPQQVTEDLQGWGSKGASLWATASLSNPPPSLTDYGNAIAQGIAQLNGRRLRLEA